MVGKVSDGRMNSRSLAATGKACKSRPEPNSRWATVPEVKSHFCRWLASVKKYLVLAAVLLSAVLLLLSGTSTSSSSKSSMAAKSVFLQQLQESAQHNTTDEPMPPELVSMPCSNGNWLQRHRFCPVINCSLAADCTVYNQECCAHLNYQMLAYLDSLLASKGHSQDYVIVYGSLLGAVRNNSVLGHTNDVDVAMSAAAIATLTQPAMQAELWRHGYVFWCSDNVWRLCAHQHHPLTAFKALMQPGQEHSLQDGPYVDAYLMWPTSADAAAAVNAAVNLTVTAGRLQTQESARLPFSAAAEPAANLAEGSTPGAASAPSANRLRGFGRREWRLCFSDVRVRLSGRRRVFVEGLRLLVPDNAEALLTGTYGPRWRTPNLRPYAPSYDEDECIEAVTRLKATLFGM